MPIVPCLVLAALLAMVAALALAPGAMAAKKLIPTGQFPPEYPESESWTPQEFNGLYPDSVAVSGKNSHIYVADSGRGAIFDFTSKTDNTPDRWNGTTTPSGSFGGEHVSVAVDNTTGDVFVADRAHKVIDKFDQDGNLIASFGDSVVPDGQLAGLKTPAGSFAPSTGNYSAFGIGIDQTTHDLYVLDAGHSVIDIFNENGGYLNQITATPSGLYDQGGENANGIAVSSAGNVYVTNLWSGPNRVYQFDSSNNYVSTWNGGNLPNGAASETPDGDIGFECNGCYLMSANVEDATGDVYVLTQAHRAIDIFDANGNYLPPQSTQNELGFNYLYYMTWIAFGPASGEILVAENNRIQTFKAAIVPDVTVGETTAIGKTEVTLNGHVDPALGEGGGPVTKCHFEYISNFDAAENEAQEPFKGAKQVPCSPAPNYGAPTNVSASASGLKPGTEYRWRLVAGNVEGENSRVGGNFSTQGLYNLSGHIGAPGSGDGQLKEPLDVAVDDSTGDLYVADAGNHRVVEFDSAGAFVRAFGADVGGPGVDVCTSGCQAGTGGAAPGELGEPGELTTPKYVEVDNSSGPSAGDVYVGDTSDNTVQKFTASGALLTGWESGGVYQFAKKEGSLGGITVDDQGTLYTVARSQPYNWTSFSQDGTSINKYPTNGTWPSNGSRLSLGTPGGGGIEVAPDGTWYETQPGGHEGSNTQGVWYSSTTADIYTFFPLYRPLNVLAQNSGIALDRGRRDIFVDQGSHIDLFSGLEECGASGCRPNDTMGTGALESGAGLALSRTDHLLYAADQGRDEVAVFSPYPEPEVVTGGATNVTTTSGTMTGHLDPGAGGEVNDCHFEYLPGSVTNEVQTLTFPGVKEGTFKLTYEGETTVPIEIAPGNPNFAAGLVEFRLAELAKVGNGNVKVTGPEGGPFSVEFLNRFAQTNVPQLTADGTGLVPGGSTVEVSTKYEGNGWQYAQSAPCSQAGPISAPVDVSAELTGLTSFTPIHYRLVGTRSDGDGFSATGQERTFTPAPDLPPSVSGTGSTGIGATTATVTAQVNPNLSPTVYRFQYGTTSSYGSQTPISEPIGEDGVAHLVSSELTGLKPATLYHYRVIGTNINGTATGPDETLTTPDVPTASALTATNVTTGGATLSAKVNPGFRSTTYHFEFGKTVAYGSSTPESAPLGSDGSLHEATAQLTGLSPETTYHFTVVANNEVGAGVGADVTFTTAALPHEQPHEVEQKKCKRGFVLKHGKCVKKPKKRHHRHHHGRSGR
jgi:NHL repeat